MAQTKRLIKHSVAILELIEKNPSGALDIPGLSALVRKVASATGIYKESIYGSEVATLKEMGQWILSSPTEAYKQLSPLFQGRDALLTRSATMGFWLKRLGKQMPLKVSWNDFAEAFTLEYGVQVPPVMEKFKAVIITKSVSEDHWVDLERYLAFCQEGRSLYQSFQSAVDPNRVVYVMGTVEDKETTKNVNPTMMESLLGLHVTQVSCGGQHAAVLTDYGEIYSWGRGGFGRLGHGNANDVLIPKKIQALSNVDCMQVACGFAYTAAVSKGGELYVWGAGENGRLGTGDIRDVHTPVKIGSLDGKRVRQVFAGSVHTCILTDDSHIYSFGKYEYTGHGLYEDVLVPTLLDAFGESRVVQVSVGPGGYHTMALTEEGDVYTWGHNRVGQLGYKNSDIVPRNRDGAFFLPTPRLVESLRGKGVCQVVAGWGHSAALTRGGHIYTCGRNLQGQLGLGDPANFPRNERGHPFQSTFTRVEALVGRHVVQLACGGEHTAALLENGEVYTFGNGQSGQLGHGNTANEHLPRLVRDLKDSRRRVKQVAGGNNCTVVLCGPRQPDSLRDICLTLVKRNPALMEAINTAGLPGELISEIGDQLGFM